jgi:PEP-CTERM motif
MKNKYNFAARAGLLVLALTAAFGFNTSVRAQALGGSLWYNGDRNHTNGLANERDDGLGFGQYAHVFDDFNVPTGQTWTVTGVYSNNYMSYVESGGTTLNVEWSISQGMSNGNGGTLIAGGIAGPGNFQVLFHSTGDFGFTEYSVNATGLNVTLTSGTYFLNVTPVGNGFGRSFTSDTSGAGCIGTPCGNNANAFFDSNFFGANYQPTSVQGQPGDFSMGVQGSIPEPATWALLGLGTLLVAVRRRRSA